jgi:hypothetical protein
MRRMIERRAFALGLIPIATVALVATACRSPAGNPAAQSVQATPTQTTVAAQEFTSERYGFRVTLTEAWSGADAVVDWDGAKLQGLTSPAFANFRDPATGRTLVVGAARVAEGMELAEWRAAVVRAAPPVCSESSSVEETSVGGEPAVAWIATCSDGDAIKLAALHGMRGYIVFLDSQTAKDPEDRRIFDSIRSSFRFTP